MSINFPDRQDKLFESFEFFSENDGLLTKVFDLFPYPLQVYAPDGTSVLVNKAILDEYHVSDPYDIVGKYNIFKDPAIIKSDHIHMLRRAFQGESVFASDVKVPLKEIADRYGVEDLDVIAIYQDITIFPIFNDFKQVVYVVALLINRRVYRGKEEIELAKEYIENHWKDGFNVHKAAKAAYLSNAHFIKLFKKHTGITPHKYYVNYKIDKLKEKLLDTNLSIEQAFDECNINYNGHFIKVFKNMVGVTPSVYRKVSS